MGDIRYHYDIEQGTPEWHDLRMGKITASQVKELVTPTGKISNSEKTKAIYYDLASQRVTGRADFFENEHTRRGHRDEPIARFAYEKKTGNTVSQCGFIDNGVIGYSPDGLVGEDGLIEIKSRLQKYQIQTIACDEVPKEYMLQIQTALFVTGRKWVDFVQYSNGMALYTKRVEPDADMIETIDKATIVAETKIQEIVDNYDAFSKDAYVCDYINYDDDENDPW